MLDIGLSWGVGVGMGCRWGGGFVQLKLVNRFREEEGGVWKD